jgi:cellulose synthase/poly-beta-1,6-N-acetylglucosamine synthase-like glycosyltransferase
MEFWNVLTYIDTTLFVLMSMTVGYMAFFAIAAQFNRHTSVPRAKRQNRFIVIIPAYKAERNLERTVASILGQTYPQRLFDITVVADNCPEMTCFRLAQQPITLLTTNFGRGGRIKSLQLAINNLPQFKIYDVVLLLEAGNAVEPEFLQQLNDAYESAGTKCIQCHRLSQNRDTATARLSAIFEEINNSLFRRGHITIGLSAAIAASGMAFDFVWFRTNIGRATANWQDKDFEVQLLRQRIFIDYFDSILVYDEKTRQADEFNRQRGSWMRSQLSTILRNFRYLPGALLNRHYDLADKILQWLLIPRVVLMAVVILMGCLLPFVYMSIAIKWWVLFAVVLLVFALATPNYLVDDKWDRTFLMIPFIFISLLIGKTPLRKHFNKWVDINQRI